VRWTPDTCKCAFDVLVVNDDWQFDRVARKCYAHADVADAELYDLVLNGENRRKNRLEWELKKDPALGLSEEKPERVVNGQRVEAHVDFRDDVSFAWRFSGSGKGRVLEFSVAGPTIDAQKRAEVQAVVEAAVGSKNLAVVDDARAAPVDVGEVEVVP